MLGDRFQRAQEKWTLSTLLLCTVGTLMFYFSLGSMNKSSKLSLQLLYRQSSRGQRAGAGFVL